MDYMPIYQHRKDASVLTLDGGGLRGIIPLIFAADVEKRTGMAVCEVFDVTAGTSAGAIGTAALHCPTEKGGKIPKFKAEQLIPIIKDNAEIIFPYSHFTTIYGLWSYKYSRDGLVQTLQPHLGETTLGDAIGEILISGSEITNKEAWWFTRNGVCSTGKGGQINKDQCRQIRMIDAVCASSAAETYLPSFRLEIDKVIYEFVDGSTFSPCPMSMALSYTGAHLGTPTLLAAFGTGKPVKDPLPPSKWGFSWAWRYPADSIEITTDQAELEAKLLIEATTMSAGNHSGEVLRWQPEISLEDYVLDDSSKEHIDRLIHDANEYINKNEKKIDEFCQQLILHHNENQLR